MLPSHYKDTHRCGDGRMGRPGRSIISSECQRERGAHASHLCSGGVCGGGGGVVGGGERGGGGGLLLFALAVLRAPGTEVSESGFAGQSATR